MATIIFRAFKYLNKKITSRFNLNKIAKQQRLKFSSGDVIGGNAIALDILKKKLVYVKDKENSASCLIIDLNKVQDCSVQKSYSDISAGALGHTKLSYFLKTIFLKLRLKNQEETLTLPIFESHENSLDDVHKLELKARDWQLQISHLLRVKEDERA